MPGTIAVPDTFVAVAGRISGDRDMRDRKFLSRRKGPQDVQHPKLRLEEARASEYIRSRESLALDSCQGWSTDQCRHRPSCRRCSELPRTNDREPTALSGDSQRWHIDRRTLSNRHAPATTANGPRRRKSLRTLTTMTSDKRRGSTPCRMSTTTISAQRRRKSLRTLTTMTSDKRRGSTPCRMSTTTISAQRRRNSPHMLMTAVCDRRAAATGNASIRT